MKIGVVKYETQENIFITTGDRIGEGSNSYLYDILELGELGEKLVGKCSKNSENYVSFNLQYNAFCACEILCEDNVVIPHMFLYGKAKNIGDILVMEKIENIYEISFVINNSLYYGEIIIKKIAESIAKLHNMGISGYDVEFYWKVDTNQLVILDIGPQYTFDVSYEEMLTHHMELEKKNNMGKWNIISQIIPQEEAKSWFKNMNTFDVENLMRYINPYSLNLHVANVAQIHALSTISKLTLQKQEYYLNIFIKEYKKYRFNLTLNSAIYLKKFSDTISHKYMTAEACLYYSTAEPLCRESCEVKLER